MAFHGSHLSGGHLGAHTAPAGAVSPGTLTVPAKIGAKMPQIVVICLIALATVLILKHFNRAKSASSE